MNGDTVIKNREKQGLLLLDAMSEINGGLLRDVEPARPVMVVRPARVRTWQRWASVAAVFLVLVVTGLIIRQVLWSGTGQMDKAHVPGEGSFPIDMAPEALPESTRGEKEAASGTEDLQVSQVSDGLPDLADRTAAIILSGRGDQVYSPLGLYQTLIYSRMPDDGGEAAADWLSPVHPERQYFSLSNCLLVPESDLAAEESSLFPIQVLATSHFSEDCLERILSGAILWDSGCPDQGQDRAVLEGRIFLQRFEANLRLPVVEDAAETVDGIRHELISQATVYYREHDRTVMAEVPVESGRFQLILPDPSKTVDELLEQNGLSSWFSGFSGKGGEAALRLPVFGVTRDHDWLGRDRLEDFEKEVENRSLSIIRQRAEFQWIPVPAEGAASPSEIVDFDRPFLFVLSDSEGHLLAAGGIRSLFD